MRIKIFAFIAACAMLAGCSGTPPNVGAAVDNDQNVLTGGPITGTTIQELPSPVKETLKERAPHAEIVSIEKTRREDWVVYGISFVDTDSPEMYVRNDGKVMPEPVRTQK